MLILMQSEFLNLKQLTMDPFLLGVLVNITTSGGGLVINKLIGKPSIKKQIEIAYEKANKRWILNNDIRRKEEIWTKERSAQFIKCYENQKYSEIDSDIIELYNLFKEEITYQQEAWRYLDDIRSKGEFAKLSNIESLVQEII